MQDEKEDIGRPVSLSDVPSYRKKTQLSEIQKARNVIKKLGLLLLVLGTETGNSNISKCPEIKMALFRLASLVILEDYEKIGEKVDELSKMLSPD